WRGAYGMLAGLALVLTVVTGIAPGWRLPARPGGPENIGQAAGEPARSRLPPTSLWPPLVLSMAAFFAYTGTGIAAAQWFYSFLTAGQHADSALAAAAVSGFWWGQTLIRAASGFISVRLGPHLLIDGSLGAALVGAAALWLAPSDVARLLAMVLFGAGLGPVFPTLISLTPSQFGGRAVEVVGYQIAAAVVGGTAVATLTGLALQRWGLLLLPATLFAGVAAVLVFHHSGLWLARRAAGHVERQALERLDT
ncbi:MAG: hypothetical protein M3170_02265, partial [Candidatus Dormibacteraeota bacterium]|nr:hypothetical protein [Candidatus Dormibacteraeota bacterium]